LLQQNGHSHDNLDKDVDLYLDHSTATTTHDGDDAGAHHGHSMHSRMPVHPRIHVVPRSTDVCANQWYRLV
jgi:hypothetical protein